jgi:hypothetical protein
MGQQDAAGVGKRKDAQKGGLVGLTEEPVSTLLEGLDIYTIVGLAIDVARVSIFTTRCWGAKGTGP